MRSKDEVHAEIQKSYDVYRQALINTAQLSLEWITIVMTDRIPEAVALAIDVTDQDDSGALVTGGWVDANGDEHEFWTGQDPDVYAEVESEISSELGNLDDHCAAQWQPYVNQTRDRLDLIKLRERFA